MEHPLCREAAEEWIVSSKYVLFVWIQETRGQLEGINGKSGKLSINICVTIVQKFIIYDKVGFSFFFTEKHNGLI